jgi:plastocyanin
MRTVTVTVIAGALALVLAPTASPHPGHPPLEIDIGHHAYAPQDAQIYQGDSVVFTWRGPDTNHSATGDKFDTDAGKSPGTVFHPLGDTYAVTFNDVGTFTYHCKVHPDMKGTITVNAAPGTAAPTVPVVTSASASPRTFTQKTTLKFKVNTPSSIRAQLRKRSKAVKEVDFNAQPGSNSHKVNFGKKLKAGKYTIRLVAVDPTSGQSSKPVTLKVAVPKSRSSASAAALDYPPITCGRISYKSKRYVVKTHGPSCTTAIKGVNGYMAHRTSPRFYKCKSYGGDIPAYCIGAIAKYKKRYFFANKV